MNIFVLDANPKKCAVYHINCHSTKMCVEYAQLLCGSHHVTESQYEIPYKLSHKNHPCSIWLCHVTKFVFGSYPDKIYYL